MGVIGDVPLPSPETQNPELAVYSYSYEVIARALRPDDRRRREEKADNCFVHHRCVKRGRLVVWFL